ncbi:MAG: hypothetical protein K6D91_05885 [Prevotella sp.]|nr:hypothetical protein [Prevotella sp.]
MEKLSIEQKAQRYDEAIERAKKVLLDCTAEEQKVVEYITPELKESEWEIIRKSIIRVVKGNMPDNYFRKKYLDWLEKQGEMDMESYKIAEDEKREFVGHGFIKCYANFKDFKEKETYWLEYVGNDNYNVRSDNLLGKTYHITPCQLYTIFKKQTWLEKQSEKKLDGTFVNIDDVREDFVSEVYRVLDADPNNDRANQIIDAFDSLPTLELEKRQVEQNPNTDFYDLRTWKYIVDAVLTEKEGIGQYFDSPFTEEVAKKLQKRFGNIEQNPTDLPNGEDYGIDGLHAAVDILQKTLGKVDGYQTDDGILEHECAISAVISLFEQKPVWSKEDNIMLQCAITHFECQKRNCIGGGNRKKAMQEYIDWLKSIEDRVQPQSTWKPSATEIKVLEEVIDSRVNPINYHATLHGILGQLKKLKGE